MKGKSFTRSRSTVSNKRKEERDKFSNNKMKGTLASHFMIGPNNNLNLNQSSFTSSTNPKAKPSLYLDPQLPSSSPHDLDTESNLDCILSQDFFCTPDYITPDNLTVINNSFECNKENVSCPNSPEKTIKCKRFRQDRISLNPLSPNVMANQQVVDVAEDIPEKNEIKMEKTVFNGKKTHSYVSQSALALRCRVMPPPCIKNPYRNDAMETDVDPFSNQRSKCAGFFSATFGGDGLSRYRTDFHEIEQIGAGNFSCVFKVLKRIDGCLYAVKQSTRLLHQDRERRKALMEVQALAALGCHENIVAYYSSWFENDQLYIQMELCDYCLALNKSPYPFSMSEVLKALYQIAKALQFIHGRGIAHLDLKPDNIYVKNGVYKLGDFGCATLLSKSLPIEEGDARYMPREILNDDYDHLDKVDIFSLGVSIYELIRGSPLPEAGPQFLNLREGKLPLLPGHPLQVQNLLKAMIDPDPVQRPSAKDVVESPIFDRVWREANT